jgi:hypothetical protein
MKHLLSFIIPNQTRYSINGNTNHMKHLIPFIILNLSFIIPVKGQLLFHENFEVPDSVITTGTNGGWASNQRLQTSGSTCDSGQITLAGGSIELYTEPFSTVGANNVFLFFNHICKTDFFDVAKVEVSPDSGITWILLCQQYMGSGLLISQGCKFSESNYAAWMPGLVFAVPDNTWWKQESFDLTGSLFNCPNAIIRFTLTDMNGNGGSGRAGWFIDDLSVMSNSGLGHVTGVPYVDVNSNAVRDVGEPGIQFKPVFENLTGNVVNSGSNGYYSIPFFDTVNVNYDISTAALTNFTVTPTNYLGSITASGQVDSLRDFAFQPISIVNDLCVSINSTLPVRSGMHTGYSIQVSNVGTTVLSPTLTYYPDASLSYVLASPLPSLISVDSLVWVFPPLLPLQNIQIQLTMLVAQGLPIGTFVSASAVVYPVAGDANPQCNVDIQESQVIGSFDPNDISVNTDTLFTFELASPPYLDYLIRFQNTGNDTAFHVQVLNEIPGELNFATFELMGTSHPVELDYHSHIRLMIFDFESILLADSNVNEPESHGYIWYRIKPNSSLMAGDSIGNSASIYFDFNDPVLTNTVLTEIVLPTGLETAAAVGAAAVQLFPNPSGGDVNLVIEGMKNEIVEIEVFDVMGKQVITLSERLVANDRMQVTIDLTALPKGTYIIRTSSKNTSLHRRFIKM